MAKVIFYFATSAMVEVPNINSSEDFYNLSVEERESYWDEARKIAESEGLSCASEDGIYYDGD